VDRSSPAPAWLLDLHRFLGATAVVLTGVHLAGLVADSYTHFGPTDLLVPFASHWRPVAVAWGVVALYLLAAVEITSLFMRRIPRKWWRAVHSSSFALFVITGVHAFTAGADRANALVQLSALFMATLFVFLVAYRRLAPRRGRQAARQRQQPSQPKQPSEPAAAQR
jgi:DMSO/TMAO reductase YedYZ heme-binding membrane subunit